MQYRISKNCSTMKDFAINDDEEHFFAIVHESLSDSENRLLHLIRQSDGTLSVYYGTFPVGKIKLQGRKHWMQILKGLQTVKVIDGEIDDFIPQIDAWKRYIKIHCH